MALIASARHTAADLALWRELEAADRVVDVPRRLVYGAQRAARAFSEEGRCWVGCSWGKDSVVLIHVLMLAGLRLPVVWVRMRGRDNPDCGLVRDACLERWDLDYHEREFVYEECTHDEHWGAVDRQFGVRRLTGLRAEESGARRTSMQIHGYVHGRSCRPLAWWRSGHVFAWLAQHGLPVHPAYACLGGGRWPRRRLRTHSIGGRTGTEHGRREWEREYYPEVLGRLRHLRDC